MVEELRREMHGGAVAAVIDRERVRLSLGERDHITDRVAGKRQRCRQDERRLDEPADRRDVPEGIVGQLVVEDDVDRKRTEAGDPHDVAVGGRLGDGLDADGAARARPVLDHDRLAERPLQ
jgi:hypothetical protein